MNTMGHKRNLIILAILLIAAITLLTPSTDKVDAALGNHGIPVRCSPTPAGQKIQPLSSAFFQSRSGEKVLPAPEIPILRLSMLTRPRSLTGSSTARA